MGNKYSRIKEKIIKRLNNKSSTTSTSICHHEEPNELKYKLPQKCDLFSHFQSPHYTLRYLWQSNYSAPVELSSGVVLDAGCGFGAWLYDMAIEYQTTDFVGIGLSPNQFPSSQMPKNVKFAQANLLCGLPFEDNEFDFVRLCYFVHSLASCEWEPVIKELIRVTKSGGWVEFVEPDLVPINMGPKFTKLMDACEYNFK
jgi:SAM-dependent methyltransferase